MFLWVWCEYRYQASRDDLAVFVALESVPAEFVNASRWFKHISVLVGPQYVPSLV